MCSSDLIPFQGLRDYQNQDTLHLLKYKFGLFSCYTGYGKSQVIATLANYAFNELGKSVLLLAPSIKAKEELVKRCKKVFGIDIAKDKTGRIKAMITKGFMNKKEMKTPEGQAGIAAELSKFEWVLADEVEYCMSDGGQRILDMCTGASCLYGFSGTADKNKGEMITFKDGLGRCIADNRDLVKYFGPSLIYRLPLHLEIDLVTVKTKSLNTIPFDEEDMEESKNIYNTVMNKIWTNKNVCETIVRVAEKYPMLFIPINSLEAVINNWIDNYFVGKFRVLLICGEGYLYWDLAGNKAKLSLEEAWEYVNSGQVDIIPSTGSGYRALDFPGLKNILLIQGKVGGVVLQAIGRVARSTDFNIITLEPQIKCHIPIYSKGIQNRKHMILDYYQYCKVTETEIREENL